MIDTCKQAQNVPFWFVDKIKTCRTQLTEFDGNTAVCFMYRNCNNDCSQAERKIITTNHKLFKCSNVSSAM